MVNQTAEQAIRCDKF